MKRPVYSKGNLEEKNWILLLKIMLTEYYYGLK